MRFFVKEILANPLIYNGQQIPFEPVGDGDGLIGLDETRDAQLIAFLDGLADKRLGGVYRVSAEVAAELKKKPRRLRRPADTALRLSPPSGPSRAPSARVAAPGRASSRAVAAPAVGSGVSSDGVRIVSDAAARIAVESLSALAARVENAKKASAGST